MISLCSSNIMENLYLKHGLVSRTYCKNSLIVASTFGSKSKFFMTMPIPSQDEPLTNRLGNDPWDFAKLVKEIALPQAVTSTSDHRIIELENQVQRLMETYLAPTQHTQDDMIGKINLLWKIVSEKLNALSTPKNTRNSIAPKALQQSVTSKGKNLGKKESKAHQREKEAKEQGKEEDEMGTAEEVEELFEDEESEMETEEKVEEVFDDETGEEEDADTKYYKSSLALKESSTFLGKGKDKG
nr:hypothetical protein [Tanacetum cinerariifolium]